MCVHITKHSTVENLMVTHCVCTRDASAESIARDRPIMCGQHEGFACDLYCKNCNMAICVYCSSTQHRSCNFCNIEQQTNESRERLGALEAALEAHGAEVRAALGEGAEDEDEDLAQALQ